MWTGLKIVAYRICQGHSLESMDFYEKLLFTGDWPQTLLDVGAHFGHFSAEFVKRYPLCKPTLVEANPHCTEQLKASQFPYKIFAASNRLGTGCFFINKNDRTSTGNSLYREKTKHFVDANIETLEVPLRTLDSEFTDETFNFIKVDVQGSELDVIHGGERIFRRARHVLMEISLVDYNENSPKAAAVIQKMRTLGFEMLDILEYHQSPELYSGCTFQVDILFQNTASKSSQRAILTPDGWREPLVTYLKKQREHDCNFSVLDIGASTNPWSRGVSDVSFDKLPTDYKTSLTGDLTRDHDWHSVLKHVQTHGRFSYAICSHTLEDLTNPQVTLDHLSLVADAGVIIVPSVQTELSKFENGPWSGYIHHRWLIDYDSTRNEMVFFPKLPLVEHFPKQQSQKERTELQIYWRGRPQYRFANDGYMGPSVDSVVALYQGYFLKRGTP